MSVLIHGAESLLGYYKYNRHRSYLFSFSDSWKQYDPAYIKALQEAAKDPKRFEEFIATQSKMESDMKNNQENEQERIKSNSTGPVSSKGYVPIEQWDKEQKELLKEMSWEQRVQFEGQRNGDQFRQNEILRKNLKTF